MQYLSSLHSAFREGHAIGLMDGAASQLKSRMKPGQSISTEELYLKYSQLCVPNESTNVQLSQVFVKFMNDHPKNCTDLPLNNFMNSEVSFSLRKEVARLNKATSNKRFEADAQKQRAAQDWR
jgi:hypothetical protein